jgi:UDP-N-acetyl-D-glucosamine dehydrogenase
LIERVRNKSALIGVVGLGYVGLPLALRFGEMGFRVLGFDTDKSKVAQLGRGESYINYIGAERVALLRRADRLEATSDFAHAARPDALILCVPTPLGDHREPDLSYIRGTMEALAPQLRRGQVLSLESTTYPGTTAEELQPRIKEKGFQIGQDFFLVYSPERMDPGNKKFPLEAIPKIVGGSTPACREVGAALYGSIVDRVVPVSSTAVAELAKLLENIYRAVNIGLVNELKMVADRMGINIWEVIDAAATKPFGFTPFYPGPGLGGHCIPIDPFYLTWKAKEFAIHTRFIELAGEINTGMPTWVAGKIADALNQRGQAVRGARILVLGIAYKKNIDDARESPSIELMDILRSKGADLSYCDPHIPVFPRMRHYRFELRSVTLDAGTVAGADCVVIATDHDVFDYTLVQEHARLVLDTRGRYRKDFANVVRC